MESNKVLISGALVFVLLTLSLPVGGQSKAPAVDCPTDGSCKLPDCYCSSQAIPGGFVAPDTPQIVYLTFDDAVTISNYPFYEAALFNRKNPNGAPISATFFLTHEYANYSLVNNLWRKGHEIALKSISHTTTTQYWATINESVWNAEILAQKEQVARFAMLPANQVFGMRSPFLQIGGNAMYSAISQGLEWECSRPTRNFRKPGLWPYTNDYKTIQECQIAPCPNEAFPGFWTVPMIDFLGDDLAPCAKVDECTPVPMLRNTTYNLLLRNFNDLYTTNRAPFGVFTHAQWVVGPVERPEFAERMAGYLQFLDYLGTLNDVYIVSISKALQWVRNPTPLWDIDSFEPWAAKPEEPQNCLFPRNCRYNNGTWERFMSSCVACPISYPWVHNHLGTT